MIKEEYTKRLSHEFFTRLHSLMYLLDYSYHPENYLEFSEQMVMRELGKLHYLFYRDIGDIDERCV